ncbi:DoxX family protein [Bacillus sp. V3B]|uniref:DoxX family protein n=1 Tax=Bacillus sp. V3B TaxID=2804915 RepID=UPI00210D5B21|nr:DoxX family protein [Bacillus sp. V3B]MCQ6276055.1 DoxX family protein [Bacillus sp. V3B]
MMVKWLRESNVSSIILTIFRLYLGYTFLTHGWEKVSGGFDASGFLQGVIKNPGVEGWWASFLGGIALPNVELFNVLVPWGEFLVGLGLIVGCFTTAAAFFGVVMNFSFLFSGVANPNALMVLLGVFILVAGTNAGKIGLDRWVLPYIRQFTNKKTNEFDVAVSAEN